MKRASALLAALGVVAACRGGSNVAPAVLTAQPPDTKPPTGPNAAERMPLLRIVLDDPRLARARELERAKDWSGAAHAVAEARSADLPVADACAWDYEIGRLSQLAGALPDADVAFTRADAPACPLAPWARLHAAQVEARAGRADDALARARAIPEDLIAARDETRLVISEALAAKGDRVGALPLWRAWLAANPHGSRWVDTSVRIATALLDGVDGPPEARAREALDLTTRILVEAPKLADSVGAPAVRSRAVAVLHAHDSTVTDALGDDDRAKLAQTWLDLGETTKALDATAPLLAKKKTGGAFCRAAIVRANAAAKTKAGAGEAWSDAVRTCEKDDQLVGALYSGAKARASKDPKTAIEWFGRVEELFPSHRLADDARYRAALLVAQGTDEGHERRAEEMLRTLPDVYPSGDMKLEALFHVALDAMKRGAWTEARPLLERTVQLAPDDRHWATAGRAEYFLARSAEIGGDAADARARYVRIIERNPLAFYMLLAHARLAAADPALAAKTLKDAVARDSEGTFPTKDHDVLKSPAASRAMRLLEVGEVDAARREFAASGALADGVDPEVLWIIGALYNQAGAPELGHAFSRGRLTDHLAHYPEGRWKAPWQIAYPRAFEPLVLKSAAAAGVSPALAWGIMREESSFVADARSHSNALGLMQLMAPTARWMATGTTFTTDEASLKTPEVSIELGVKLLGKLRATHGNLALAIGAYNGGSGAVDRWVAARSGDDVDLFIESIPWDETRNYVKRVLSSEAAYAYLYDPPALADVLALPLRFAH